MMKTLLCAGALALASVSVSGCAGVMNATPEQQATLVTALAKAGCKGSLTISVGGATGQLGGGFHADNTFNGSCDPANVPNSNPAASAAAAPAAAAVTTPAK